MSYNIIGASELCCDVNTDVFCVVMVMWNSAHALYIAVIAPDLHKALSCLDTA